MFASYSDGTHEGNAAATATFKNMKLKRWRGFADTFGLEGAPNGDLAKIFSG